MNSHILLLVSLLTLTTIVIHGASSDQGGLEETKLKETFVKEPNQKLVAAIAAIPKYITIVAEMVKLGKTFLGLAFNRKTSWTDAFDYQCQYRLAGRFCRLHQYRFRGHIECKGLGQWGSSDCLKRKDKTAFEVPYRQYVVALCRAGKDKTKLIDAINSNKEVRPEARADIVRHLHSEC